MKKLFLAFLSMATVLSVFAQNEYKKRPAIGIHFFYDDFATANDLRTNSLANVLKARQYNKTSRMVPGLAASYTEGISNYVDVMATLSGSFLTYPIPNKTTTFSTQDLLLELAATGNLKLLSDHYWFTPYLTAGIGASKYNGYYGAFAPVGAGFQINLFDEAFILLGSQYRIPVTENVAHHFYHSIGILGNIGNSKKVQAAPVAVNIPVVETPKDTDGDGIIDINDKCPNVAGLAAFQGCPDTDGDGIPDDVDKCPTVAGVERYQGCPIPDTDGDGINDEVDKCPTVAGTAKYQGCPIPDTDGDGVNDEEDKCINEKGPASNFGCPVISQDVIAKINKAAAQIYFASGSSKLLPKSYAPLNAVAGILNQNPSYNVAIDGHTDNTGKADKNQALSEARAAAVKAYLVSKGVADSKLVATGYGQDKPIADNKTLAGKAKNRRVELNVKNY